MLALSENNIRTIFADDVKAYFDKNDIRYTQDIGITGKSGLNTKYDFVIPGHNDTPERFIAPINKLRSDITKTTIFSWQDVCGTRPDKSVLYTIINDRESKGTLQYDSNIKALKNFGIESIEWSSIDKKLHLFSA